ncbi:hypothetical protein [Flavobacterium limi]|uniref:Uncharacterized protein n=1 Tax=Flavobacterium limi TaxID=2045105 RepID=A0ABQ1UNL7_9FLAO|nr:hypothetical protein [Flavobacterium limi]GGF22406.1 hypothetical protein GCM10011518_34530 [Flavobacterium limi]
MKKIVINKEAVISSVTKMVADKSAVRSFLKGKTSIETLTQKGIKFAKPI